LKGKAISPERRVDKQQVVHDIKYELAHEEHQLKLEALQDHNN
jgi:hypothetical protein